MSATDIATDQDRTAPVGLYAAILVSAIIAWFGRGTVIETLGMYDLGASANPYWIPAEWLRLYVIVPATTLATGFFFLSPGLLLASVFGRDKGLATWVLAGFAWALLCLVVATTGYQLITGHIAKGASFFWLVIVVLALAFGVTAARVTMGERNRLTESAADMGWAIAAAWLLLALMAPKFYWENFSGDGSGSLQFTRNYINTLWPFWPPEAGTIQQAPGLTSFLFVLPDNWFVRLWGEWEYSVRAPMALYFLLLWPVVTALIHFGRDEVLRNGDRVLLIGTLMVYALSVIYSGGYNPYFGDSPMPAVRETLAVALFMGFMLAFFQDRRGMMILCGLLGHLTIPTGGLWMLLFPAAVFLTWRPIPWKRLFFAAFVLVLAAMVSVLVPLIIKAVGLPIPGSEFGPKAIVNRLRWIAPVDFYRFMFLIVPCGILPALFLLHWRGQDKVARAITVATLLFFFFFYLQGYRVLLHHFIPIMLAPVVVFWRNPVVWSAAASRMRIAALVCLATATWLAWPKEMKLHSFDRHIGQHLVTMGPVFQRGEPVEGDRFRGFDPQALDVAHHLLGNLFPIGWTEEDAQKRFYGAPLVWWFYSEYPKPEGQPINYTIRPVDGASATDGRLFEEYLGYGLYIRDEALYQQHWNTTLPTNTGAQIFVTPRNMMFGRGTQWGDRIVFDLVDLVRPILGIEKPPA